MDGIKRLLVPLIGVLVLMGSTLPASAEHEDDPRTDNLHPMGHIEEPRSLFGGPEGDLSPDIHTDLAFWGKYAFQGSWLGFNIRDISAPGNPRTISHTSCEGNQGDIIVWEDVLVRSWNTPAGTPGVFGAGTTCDGEDVPDGFEGLHVFDISDLRDPALVGAVELSAREEADAEGCGSHTATGVPDPDNGRLLVYNSSSSGDCPGIDIVEIPLDDPANPEVLGFAQAGRPCHDTSVILGDALLAACAGGDGFTMFSMSAEDGGSLEDPQLLYSVNVNDDVDDDGVVSIGHSTSFSWDGEVVIFGHEPGGGIAAQCQDDTPDSHKSAFFYDAGEGEFLGMWTIPRPQSEVENCTFHNFNVVPLRNGDRIMVHGSYQSGTSVVDFNDPENPVEVAWSDPDPLPLVDGSPFCGGSAEQPGCDVGGAWSSYWYNNFIYETNITEGLNIFRFSGRETAGAMRLSHLNPQTQDFTIP